MTTIRQPDWWNEWTYFDEQDLSTKLKDGAPESVRNEWEELQSLTGMIEE